VKNCDASRATFFKLRYVSEVILSNLVTSDSNTLGGRGVEELPIIIMYSREFDWFSMTSSIIVWAEDVLKENLLGSS
jgi:hypothetical protein